MIFFFLLDQSIKKTCTVFVMWTVYSDVGHFVPLPLRTLDTSYLRDTSYRTQIGHFVPWAGYEVTIR